MLDGATDEMDGSAAAGIRRVAGDRPTLTVIIAAEQELQAHHARLDAIEKASGSCVWRSKVEE